MNDAVKVEHFNGYAIVVKYDSNAESPREWSNLGRLYLKTRSVTRTECSEEAYLTARVKVPVYKYEHSGICLKASTDGNPFSCPWDSCLAGYIVAFADDIRKEFGVKRITNKIIQKTIDILKGEVETYSQYVEGEVYGFVTYKVDNNVPDDDIEREGEEIDSCWGFYSIEDAIHDGKECLPEEVLKETTMA